MGFFLDPNSHIINPGDSGFCFSEKNLEGIIPKNSKYPGSGFFSRKIPKISDSFILMTNLSRFLLFLFFLQYFDFPGFKGLFLDWHLRLFLRKSHGFQKTFRQFLIDIIVFRYPFFGNPDIQKRTKYVHVQYLLLIL